MKRFVNPPLGARSRRLDSHDYRGGAYFVTTNAKKRILSFGTIERGRMYLNECGRIVAEEWQRTGDLRDEVSLDAFIVMPDHVHGLLWICHSDNDQEEDETRRKHHFQEGKQKTKDCEGEARTSREENREVPAGKDGREMHLATSSELPPGLEKRRAGTLSTIMGCFKAAATRRINEKRDAPGETIWQSSFHDHIVRNRKELHRIRRYIRTNPQQESRS